MKRFLLSLIVVITGLYGCNKDDSATFVPANIPSKHATTVATGVVTGKIAPEGAATKAYLLSQLYSREVDVDNNGIFKFISVPAGTYVIKATGDNKYNPLDVPAVTVIAGKTTNLATVILKIGTGGIFGSIAPVNAGTKLTVTNNSTKVKYQVVPDKATGKFKITGMVPGDYVINFKAASPSVAPKDIEQTVYRDQDTDVGIVVFKTPNVTSSISGTLSPAGLATVLVTNPKTFKSEVIYPDLKTGKFESNALLPGNYSVSFFVMDRSHGTPAKQVVTLAAGQNLDFGRIVVPLDYHELTCIVNGKNTGFSQAGCTYSGSALRMSGFRNSIVGIANTIEIKVDGVHGPGTYHIKGTDNSSFIYTERFLSTNWNTDNGGSGSVKIIAIDTKLKTIAGTFTAKLKPNGNAQGDLVITNGSFLMSY